MSNHNDSHLTASTQSGEDSNLSQPATSRNRATQYATRTLLDPSSAILSMPSENHFLSPATVISDHGYTDMSDYNSNFEEDSLDPRLGYFHTFDIGDHADLTSHTQSDADLNCVSCNGFMTYEGDTIQNEAYFPAHMPQTSYPRGDTNTLTQHGATDSPGCPNPQTTTFWQAQTTRSAASHLGNLIDTALIGAEEPASITYAHGNRRGIDPEARRALSNAPIVSLEDHEKQNKLAVTKSNVENWLGTGSGNTINNKAPHNLLALSLPASHVALGSTDHSVIAEASKYSFKRVEQDVADNDMQSNGTEDSLPVANPKKILGGANVVASYTLDNNNQSTTAARRLWEDYSFEDATGGIQGQPSSSNAAMERFNRRARDIETASLAATVGSRRRSEADLASLYSASGISLRIPTDKEPPSKPSSNRRQSFLGRVISRTPSNTRKRKTDEKKDVQDSSMDVSTRRKESLSSKITGFARPKSPRPDAEDAQICASTANSLLGSINNPWSTVTNALRRSRSRSDLGTPGIADQWASHGGPPLPTLKAPPLDSPRSPLLLQVPQIEKSERSVSDDDADGDEEDATERFEDIAFMPLVAPQNATAQSFKAHALKANPDIEIYMLERLTQEQVKRFQRLLEARMMHDKFVGGGQQCESGEQCVRHGATPRYLQPRGAGKIAGSTSAPIYVVKPTAVSAGNLVLENGSSQPATFPEGLPLPPVDRLPAEFECPLCFQVKSFSKPSDWTKHVHEDLQPFTCTFPDCIEAKSFKRKADWVRHENERHRQLERWDCNIGECGHVCFRKDNFVQHLVREHKKPEPRMRAAKSKVQSRQGEDNVVTTLLEICRVVTNKEAKHETCRFCQMSFPTWKKLTVHLAKHMEQISLPLLHLLHTKDTAVHTVLNDPGIGHSFRVSPHGSEGSECGTWHQPHHPPPGPNSPIPDVYITRHQHQNQHHMHEALHMGYSKVQIPEADTYRWSSQTPVSRDLSPSQYTQYSRSLSPDRRPYVTGNTTQQTQYLSTSSNTYPPLRVTPTRDVHATGDTYSPSQTHFAQSPTYLEDYALSPSTETSFVQPNYDHTYPPMQHHGGFQHSVMHAIQKNESKLVGLLQVSPTNYEQPQETTGARYSLSSTAMQHGYVKEPQPGTDAFDATEFWQNDDEPAPATSFSRRYYND